MTSEFSEEPRRLSAVLLVAMLTLPTISVWFFLRRGYAPSLRRIAFIYTGTFFVIGLLGGVSR